jgi:hypothetical protein
MEKNVGKLDRIIRIIIGIVLLGIGIFLIVNNPSLIILSVILIIIGVISLGTAATGFCILYKPFNINTKKSEE